MKLKFIKILIKSEIKVKIKENLRQQFLMKKKSKLKLSKSKIKQMMTFLSEIQLVTKQEQRRLLVYMHQLVLGLSTMYRVEP